MASNSAIAVTFKIDDGNGGLKKITLDADGLRKIMEKNVEVTQEMTKKVFSLAATFNTINAANSALKQLTSTFSNLTGESTIFAKAMAEANTMAGKDAAGFKQLKGQVADLAKEIPIARDMLANGLYQTISNGVPEDNWIEFLKTSARSAVGGLADINKVVGVTSTVIKNYGLDWSDAADIQDKIQLTAKNGVTSFEQLAQALPRVTGNAATLGVSIDELMGTFATLTGVSGNTAEVSTQLAAIFTSLVKPSSEASKMAAQMGIRFDAAAIKAAGGFQNFLTQLDSSIKAYAQSTGVLEQEVYGKLFGSAEALRALIPLQGELAEKFASNIGMMVNSAGTMDEAFATMANEGGATATMLTNWWNALMDHLAGFTSMAQPYIDFFAGFLSAGANVYTLAKSLASLNIRQMKTATSSLAVAAAQKTASAATAVWAAVQKAFNAVLSANPIAITIIAIAALTAGVIYAYKHFEGFREVVDEVWDAIKPFAKAIMNGVVAALKAVVKWCKDAWEGLRKLLGLGGQKIEVKVKTETSDDDGGLDGLERTYTEFQDKPENSNNPTKISDPGEAWTFTTIEQFTAKRKYLQELCEKADFDQKIRIEQEIALLDQLQQRLETQAKWRQEGVTVERFHSEAAIPTSQVSLAPPETVDRKFNGVDRYATSLRGITDNIEALNAQLQDANGIGEASLINEQIALWEKKAEAIRNAGKEAVDTTRVITDAVGSMGNSLSTLGNELELPALNVAGTMAQAIATMVQAYATASAQSATLGPFGWLAFSATGLAQLVAMVATVKNLPAFANGGIISGPTVGLMGEYPGAANNPEVVAPLNTLRNFLKPTVAPMGGKVVFEIKGRTLMGVLKTEEKFNQRT